MKSPTVELRLERAQQPAPHNGPSLQVTLFETADHPLLETIRGTDLNRLTPLEVQQLVHEWQEQLDVHSKENGDRRYAVPAQRCEVRSDPRSRSFSFPSAGPSTML